ncbi:MAG: hypothetical protein RL273_633 [Bacteroidota bacterium]|jgi:predicted RNase H-like nuclease (RuvC/YqgF family)
MTEEKSKALNVRITSTQFDKLKQEADDQDISLAERVRQMIDNDVQSEDEDVHKSYIEQLKQQIKYLQNEIQKEEKQVEYLQNEMQNERKNNSDLMKLLDQQQQLTLTNNKRIELLETEIEEKEDTGWFKRIFSK